MPDNSSLLVRLQKYASRENHSPRENFLTEVFTWVLEKCPEFAEKFINELNEITQGTKFDTDPEHWKWKTQEYLKDGSSNSSIVDIVGNPVKSNNSPHIFIEVKLWSGQGKNQLKDYKEKIEKNYTEGSKLFLLKPENNPFDPDDIEGVPVLTWERVNEIAKSVKDETNNAEFFVLEEFICLLDKFGLHKISSRLPEEFDNYLEEGVDMHILEALSKSNYVMQTLKDALIKAANKLNEDKDINKDENARDCFQFVDNYGRFGIACSEKKTE